MRRRTLWQLAGLGGLTLAALAFMLWPRPGDEEQILRLLQRAEAGLEKRSVRQSLACLSKDYHDSYGNTREELQREALGAFRQIDSLSIAMYSPQIRVQGTEAQVNLDLLVQITRSGRLESLPRMKVTLALRKERRGWKVVDAEGWGEAQTDF